jgi:hypothetical protein
MYFNYQLTFPLLFSLLYILDITVISTRAIPFVGLVEMRRYLEFKSLVSVGVVHADSTLELDRTPLHIDGNYASV